MTRRVPALAFGLLVLGGMLLAPAPDAHAGGRPHPYFNDGGALDWYHSLAEAQRAARAEGKLIFVEYGRLRCPSCRKLCSQVLGAPSVRGRLSQVAVGLAAECDRPEAAIRALFQRHLPNAPILPFAAFLTPDGRWITGFYGGSSVRAFSGHLHRAEAAHARLRPAPAPRPVARPARPVVTPRPRPTPAPARRPEANCAPPRRVPTPPAVREPTVPNAPRETPLLQGDPDARSVDGQLPPMPTPAPVPAPSPGPAPADCANGDCAPPRVARPTGPLPPPRIVIGPPVAVRPAQARPAQVRPAQARSAMTPQQPVPRPPSSGTRVATGLRLPSTPVGRAQAAAKRGEWSEVLRLAQAAPADPTLRHLGQNAHRWADARLDSAAEAVASGRFRDGLDAVEDVLRQMAGQPEAVDADRGLQVIRTAIELQYLNREGEVARTVRRTAHEELRGTRWSRIFE